MISGYVIAFGITLLSFAIFPTGACSQAEGSKVVILLRLAGDNGTLPPLRSCLTSRLSTMPDTEVAVAPTDGVRFVVDIIATKHAVEAVFASLVVAETVSATTRLAKTASTACFVAIMSTTNRTPSVGATATSVSGIVDSREVRQDRSGGSVPLSPARRSRITTFEPSAWEHAPVGKMANDRSVIPNAMTYPLIMGIRCSYSS